MLEKFQKSGVTIYNIKPEERDKWNVPIKGIEDEWIKDMSAKGLPAQKTFDEFIKIAKQVAQ